MAKRLATATPALGPREKARSLAIAAKGVHSLEGFSTLLGLLMADLVAGRLGPSVVSGVARRASRELLRASAAARAARGEPDP